MRGFHRAQRPYPSPEAPLHLRPHVSQASTSAPRQVEQSRPPAPVLRSSTMLRLLRFAVRNKRAHLQGTLRDRWPDQVAPGPWT